MAEELDFSNKGIRNIGDLAAMDDGSSKSSLVNSSSGERAPCAESSEYRFNKIDLSDNPLASLEGIGIFHSTDMLWLSKCGLNNLRGVQELKKIHTICFPENSIASLEDIAALDCLKMIDARNNRLTSLNGLEGLSRLEMLYAGNNSIESIEALDNHPNLIDAYLSNNRIESIPIFNNLGGLRTIYLNDNRIRSVEGIRNLDSLHYLNLNGNPVGRESLEQILKYKREGMLPNLKVVSVEDCGIDWSSRKVHDIIGEFKGYGVKISHSEKYINLRVPGYAVVDKIGEGGTFDVFLLQRTEKKRKSREEVLKSVGIDPGFRLNNMPFEDFISLVSGMLDSKFKTLADVSGNINYLLKVLGFANMIYPLIAKGEEFVEIEVPIEDYRCLLFPKEREHSQKYVNPSGYRALKDIGSLTLFERSKEIYRLLDGLSGLPKLYEETEIEFEDTQTYSKPVKVRCLVEEHIRGQTLEEALSDHTNALNKECCSNEDRKAGRGLIIKYIADAAEILDSIHKRGVIHNDVSPNNILVDEEGKIYVIDYSLSSAKRLDPLGYVSRRYSSPEVLKTSSTPRPAGELDQSSQNMGLSPASDIWSLGVMLYKLMKGKHPFSNDGDEVIRILSNKREFDEKIKEMDFGGLPENICGILRHCIEYDPRQRYQTAAEFACELRKAA